MITAELVIDNKDLARILASEQKTILGNRATFDAHTKNDTTIINIQAQDATAFRAIQNSICKILIIHEQTIKVINDRQLH